MKICPNCNYHATDDKMFCPECGATLYEATEVINNQNKQPAAQAQYASRPVYNVAPATAMSKTDKWCNLLLGFMRLVLILEVGACIIGGIAMIASGLGDWGDEIKVVFASCLQSEAHWFPCC